MCPVSIGTSRTLKKTDLTQAKLWLILVGVNQYADPNIPPLRYSALDCQGLAEALSELTLDYPQKDVKSYHDFATDLPDLKAVRASLQEIATNAQPTDTILFYFSGHGMVEPQTQQAVLCLADTRKDKLLETGLPVPELLNWLGKCRAPQQLVWLDACHSGGMSLKQIKPESGMSESPMPQLVTILEQTARKSKGFYALLSCDEKQQSWEFPELGHGVFTYYLMRGLRGEAADAQGAISVDHLYRYVYYQTLQYIDKVNQQLRLINQQKRGRGDTQLQSEYPLQTPKRIVEGIGELILGCRKTSPGLRYPRQALIVEGLDNHQTTLAFSKMLVNAGSFELEYWSKHKTETDLKSQIQELLQIKSDQESSSTALLYLQGKLESTLSGESDLVLSKTTRISCSWLRQQLRHSRVSQQVILLDCLGNQDLQTWLEDLQLDSNQGQCILAGISPPEAPETLAKAFLKTLETTDKTMGLPVAGWITQLQVELAGTPVKLYTWLSGMRGVIEVLPARIGARGIESINSAEGLDLGICPYRGLRAFTEADALYFYGRESLVQQLVNTIHHQSFLAVIGASGSGKSSIVQAGLMAQLRTGKQVPGSEEWEIKVIRPGASPLQGLAQALSNSQEHQTSEIEGLLHLGIEGFVYFLRSRSQPVTVLMIDQFEELFTISAEGERTQFLELLFGGLHYASDRLKVILTLRADFIEPCLAFPYLAQGLQTSSILIPPQLTLDAYRDVIVKPAEQVGLVVEPELVEVLLQELDHCAGDLPLLEFVLEQLWECRDRAQLTLHAYLQQIGGLKGALERKAQAVYESLDELGKACAQWVFLSLAHWGEGGEYTKRKVLKSELVVPKYPLEFVEKTLQVLTSAKLIVVDGEWTNLNQQSRTVGDDHADPVFLPQPPTVEIAHEIIIRHWSTLRWWLDENRDRLRQQRQLEQAALLWKQGGNRLEFLLQGVRLTQAEEIYIHYTDELSEDVQVFIEACLQERQRQQQEIKRRLRRTQIVAGVIGILAIATSSLAWFSHQQKLTAQLQEIEALNAASEAFLLSNQQLEALIASVQAAQQLKQVYPIPAAVKIRTASTLEQALRFVKEQNRLQAHSQKVNAVTFSPNGQFLATASDDQSLVIWRKNGKLVTQIPTSERVLSVSFSPDSQEVITGSANRTIQWWKLDGTLIKTLPAHQDWVTSLTVSANGQYIASGSRDKTVKIWTQQGQLLTTLKGHQGWINSVTFSPNQQLLASASEEGTLKLWTLQGKLVKTLKGHRDRITQVRFSPDGQFLASVSGDRTVKLWNLSGQLLQSWETGNDQINSIIWSSPSQALITASGHQIQVWDLEGNLLQTLKGHRAEITQISLSPDSKILASASADKTVRLWEITPDSSPSSTTIYSAVFSPNYQQFAAAGWDDLIQIYNAQTSQQTLAIPSQQAIITQLAFSPDSQILASAAADHSLKLWNPKTGKLIHTLAGHTDSVNAVSFSPNQQILASGSADKTIKLWNPQTGTLIQSFRAHQDSISSLSFSPNSQFLASGSFDQTVKIWRLDGSLVKTFKPQKAAISALAFSPDHQILAIGSWDNKIQLWNLQKDVAFKTLIGYNGGITSLNFSSDGKILGSSSANGTIQLWDKETGTLLKTLTGDRSRIYSVNFSPNNQFLISAGEETGVTLWTLDLDTLLPQGCQHLKDYLQTGNTDSSEICSAFSR